MISTGGEGKVSARKRLRGKIGNPSRAPEIKSINPIPLVPAPGNFYTKETIYGVWSNDPNYRGVWNPILFRWPAIGAENYQRIGKRIRVKYLRFKGFCASSPFLIQQVRYRIVLYRLKKHYVVLSGTPVERYDQAWLNSLYKWYDRFDEAEPVVADIALYAARNYYNSYMDPDAMKEQDCKRRVLFKGLLKPNQDIGNFGIAQNALQLGTGYPAESRDDEVVLQSIGTIYQIGAGQNPNVAVSYFNSLPDSYNAVPSSAAKNVVGVVQRRAVSLTTNTQIIPILGEYQRNLNTSYLATPINSKAFFPIDFVVNMNDNIDCEEYSYVVVIESDVAVGQTPNGNFLAQTSNSNFYFELTPHLYYTDD